MQLVTSLLIDYCLPEVPIYWIKSWNTDKIKPLTLSILIIIFINLWTPFIYCPLLILLSLKFTSFEPAVVLIKLTPHRSSTSCVNTDCTDKTIWACCPDDGVALLPLWVDQVSIAGSAIAALQKEFSSSSTRKIIKPVKSPSPAQKMSKTRETPEPIAPPFRELTEKYHYDSQLEAGAVYMGGQDRMHKVWGSKVCSLELGELDLNRTRKPDV